MDICRKYVELHDKIKHIKMAMLTIRDSRGKLRSMPMITMKTECEGNVWFFTSLDSVKVDEMRVDPLVNLSYADQEGEIYVSISGRAEIVHDREKMREFWKPVLEEWFPGGIESDNIALLKIEMEQAEYWNKGKMVEIWDTTAALRVEDGLKADY